MNAAQLKELIETGLEGADVLVKGDDGVHFEARVVSQEFEGKSLIQQHKMVYAALGGRMESEEIHALALKTFTPEKWQAAQDRA